MALEGVDATDLIKTSDDHPWWVAGKGWVETKDLAAGMAVVTQDGRGMTIASAQATNTHAPVHNLTIEDFHTFFVGKECVLVHNCGGKKPANLSPEGAGRRGAFGEAKRQNDVPVSQQSSSVTQNVDRRGNPQPGRQYEFQNNKGETVTIRDDAAGHQFPDDPTQNRGPHFNDDQGRHFDYEND